MLIDPVALIERRGRASFRFLLLLGAIFSVTAFAGLAGWWAVDHVSRADTHEMFARLAAATCEGASVRAEPPQRSLSDAEMRLAVKHLLATLRDVARHGQELAEVAVEAESIVTGWESLREQQPGFAPIAVAAAVAVTGVLSGNDSLSRTGAERGLDEFNKLAMHAALATELVGRWNANQLALARLAPQFSGGSTNACFLSGTFVERGLILGPEAHSLTLMQQSGVTLHDNLVVIMLIDEDRETTTHVHFIPEWSNGQPLVLNYAPVAFADCPLEVHQIAVRHWGLEQSSPSLTLRRPALFGW